MKLKLKRLFYDKNVGLMVGLCRKEKKYVTATDLKRGKQ